MTEDERLLVAEIETLQRVIAAERERTAAHASRQVDWAVMGYVLRQAIGHGMSRSAIVENIQDAIAMADRLAHPEGVPCPHCDEVFAAMPPLHRHVFNSHRKGP